MNYYDVFLGEQKFRLQAWSYADANRRARDMAIEPIIKLLKACKTEREQIKFYNKHRVELEGPKTVVAVLTSREQN